MAGPLLEDGATQCRGAAGRRYCIISAPFRSSGEASLAGGGEGLEPEDGGGRGEGGWSHGALQLARSGGEGSLDDTRGRQVGVEGRTHTYITDGRFVDRKRTAVRKLFSHGNDNKSRPMACL